jgi:hypothetical protein
VKSFRVHRINSSIANEGGLQVERCAMLPTLP